jgi:hypothetical protein
MKVNTRESEKRKVQRKKEVIIPKEGARGGGGGGEESCQVRLAQLQQQMERRVEVALGHAFIFSYACIYSW